MDTPTTEDLAHNDVPDVAASRLADLLSGSNAELLACAERLIAAIDGRLETSLGWNSFLPEVPSAPPTGHSQH